MPKKYSRSLCSIRAHSIEAYFEEIRKRYRCSLGEKSGYCDGTSNGSRMRCPEYCQISNEPGRGACQVAL